MRKLILTTAAVAAAIAGAFAAEPSFGTFTDTRDGQTYKTTAIRDRTWMAENLNYKTDSSWCYKNADSNCVKYGRLYNWYAAMSACPSGWYLPTKADWREIASGGAASRGYYGALARLKAVSGWNNKDCFDLFSEKYFVGSDEYGFSALPGGERSAVGEFVNIGFDGYWWTSTEGVGFEHDLLKEWKSTVDIGNGAYRRSITHCNGVVGETGYGKGRGYSVRCIQGDGSDNGGKLSDSTRRKMEEEKRTEADQRKKEAQHRIDSLSDYFTDSRDGRIYRTVTIGGKTWMAQNLNYKTGKSWCYNNDTSYCNKYGRLYDFNTAKTACPSGWHLSARQEWDDLGQAVGGDSDRQKTMDLYWSGAGKTLKSVNGWNDEMGKSGNGSDAYGFSALPGGARFYKDSRFYHVGDHGYWWTATELFLGSPHIRTIDHKRDLLAEYDRDKRYGLSARCVQNKRKAQKQGD